MLSKCQECAKYSVNIASCNTHQHPKSQVLLSPTPQFTERPKAAELSSIPNLPTPPHCRLGAPEALLDLPHPIQWPSLTAPQIVNRARLPLLFLLEICNWTPKRAISLS